MKVVTDLYTTVHINQDVKDYMEDVLETYMAKMNLSSYFNYTLDVFNTIEAAVIFTEDAAISTCQLVERCPR